jgi:hypothetical protein
MKNARLPEFAYKSSLDESLIKVLDPLRKDHALVHVPFFANTFPLAFHYWQCTQDENGNGMPVKLVRWGEEEQLVRARKLEEQPTVFYSSEAVCEQLKKTDLAGEIDHIPLWTYKPRLIFAEYGIKLREIDGELPKGASGLANFGDLAKRLIGTFDPIEVFTEIEDVAIAIVAQYFPDNKKECPIITANNCCSLDERHLRGTTIRLYVYGAPMAMYFSRKKRFLGFEVSETGKAAGVKTAALIHSADASTRASVATALKSYHVALLDACAEPKTTASSFRAIQYYYNRFARVMQHRSSFPTGVEYARSIVDHQERIV